MPLVSEILQAQFHGYVVERYMALYNVKRQQAHVCLHQFSIILHVSTNYLNAITYQMCNVHWQCHHYQTVQTLYSQKYHNCLH